MKEKRIFDYFANAKEKYDGLCKRDKKTGELKLCPLLSAVVALDTERPKRPGFEMADFVSTTSGKALPRRIVYFTGQTQYAEIEHCPFCGNKVSDPRRSA
jgi:hypothetical protein